MDHLPVILSDGDRHEPCLWYKQGNFKFKIGRVKDRDLYLIDSVKKQSRYILEQIAAADRAPSPDQAPIFDLIMRAATAVHTQYLKQFDPDRLTPDREERCKKREAEYLEHLQREKATPDGDKKAGRVSDLVWEFIQVPEVTRGQARVVRDALAAIGHGTLFDIGAEAARQGLKTKQDPSRIAYWYLHIWEREGAAIAR